MFFNAFLFVAIFPSIIGLPPNKQVSCSQTLDGCISFPLKKKKQVDPPRPRGCSCPVGGDDLLLSFATRENWNAAPYGRLPCRVERFSEGSSKRKEGWIF